MKKTKILFLVITIAVVSISAVVFGLDFFASRAKAIEVVDPWNFCAKGEDCSGDYVEPDEQDECIGGGSFSPRKLPGCIPERMIFGSGVPPYSDAKCCPGLAKVKMHLAEGIQLSKFPLYVPLEYFQCISCAICKVECENLDQKMEIDKDGDIVNNADEKCFQCLRETISASLCDECRKEDKSCGGREGKPDTHEIHSNGCFECIGKSISFYGRKNGDYFADVFSYSDEDSFGSDYSRAACKKNETAFFCSSGQETTLNNNSPCPYPMSSANSRGVSVKSSSGREAQLRKSLEEASGKLDSGVGKQLSKLEGLNDKEFKRLVKRQDKEISESELNGIAGFSTLGGNGEEIIVINEENSAVQNCEELSNILAHELAHFRKYDLGKEDSRFLVAWYQAAGGDIYDPSLRGKSTWPDGSKSKNGCVNTYACTEYGEDVTETLRRAIKDPAKFKSLFLDSGGQYYDPRFRTKLELLARFGFINQAQLNAILCVGK